MNAITRVGGQVRIMHFPLVQFYAQWYAVLQMDVDLSRRTYDDTGAYSSRPQICALNGRESKHLCCSYVP